MLVTTRWRKWVSGNRKNRQAAGESIGYADIVTVTGPATNFPVFAEQAPVDSNQNVFIFQFWSIQGKTNIPPMSLTKTTLFDVTTTDITATAWYLPQGGSGTPGSAGVVIDAFDVNAGDFVGDDFVDVSPDALLTATANLNGVVGTANAETITAYPALPSNPSRTFDTYKWFIVYKGNSNLTTNNRDLKAQANDYGVALALYFTPADCTFTPMPMGVSVGVLGTVGSQKSSFNVSARDACVWQAVDISQSTWFRVTGVTDAANNVYPPTTTVAGNGSVFYTVDANPGAGRSGIIYVNGQPFTIQQDGVACVFKLPAQPLYASPAGLPNGSVALTANYETCEWTADSTSWITLNASGTQTSVSSNELTGRGGGTLQFSIGSTTSARTGTITVNQQVYTVHQDAWTYTLPTNVVRQDYHSGTGSFRVVTNYPDAPWTATTTSNWIRITNGPDFVGTGVVEYEFDENPYFDTVPVGMVQKWDHFRFGFIQVADQELEIHQRTRTKQLKQIEPDAV